VQKTLAGWQRDPDLAGVRSDAALDKLPQAEQEAWRLLWADVGKTLAKVQVQVSPGKQTPKKP
jgi:hypothetical protein